MPNEHRGEVTFRALGRELFLVYGTREIAEAWSALGFRRPDPLQPVAFEEVDGRRAKVGFPERYQRTKDAFDIVFTNPDPEALRKILRIGLGRCERASGAKMSDGDFELLCDELGMAGLGALHVATYINALQSTPGADDGAAEDSDPNAQSAAPASSTSSTS